MTTAAQVISHMQSLGSQEQAQHLMRFFKTEPGSYGHGDKFLGIRVPDTRKVAAVSKQLSLNEIEMLLDSQWHEVRLCGLLILVSQFEAQSTRRLFGNNEAMAKRDEIVAFYLSHTCSANNWDLVDLSVYKILGKWLMTPSSKDDKQKLKIIDLLAASDDLWEQRMSVVCTMEPLKQCNPSYTLRYCEWHLHHNHDLMHKAVGWLLREMGKRVSMDLLRSFLEQHAHDMPRTALRYAIEKMPEQERKQWMQR